MEKSRKKLNLNRPPESAENNIQLDHNLLHLGLIVMDQELNIRYANHKISEYTGLKKNEIINHKYTELPLNTIHHDRTTFSITAHPPFMTLSLGHGIERVQTGIKNREDNRINWVNASTVLVKSAEDQVNSIILIWEDINELVQLKNELELVKAKLKVKSASLEEKEIILNNISDIAQDEKKELSSQIEIAIEKRIRPILKTLGERIKPENKQYLELLDLSISELIETDDQTQIFQSNLSPRELEIITMIKNGLHSKEIADLLNISEGTVRQQRKSIRKKLGLDHQKTNLMSYLQDNK